MSAHSVPSSLPDPRHAAPPARARRADQAPEPSAQGFNRDSWWRVAFYNVSRAILALTWTVIMRPRALGVGNVPMKGSVLIASNHQSYLDPPMLGAFVPRRIDYVARAGLFKWKPFAWLISAFNAIPIRENEGDSQAIRLILQRLSEGRAVLIFPEGTRTNDGAMGEFKRGVALLVRKANCPVVPAAIEGAFDAWPRGKGPRPKGWRVYVAYGKPIPADELMKDGPDAALRRLEREIDAMRLDLRERMRDASVGTYPAKGPGDFPLGALARD